MSDFGSAKSYSSVSESVEGCDLCCEECVDTIWLEVTGCVNFSIPLEKGGFSSDGRAWWPKMPPAEPIPGEGETRGMRFIDGLGRIRWMRIAVACRVEGDVSHWTVILQTPTLNGAAFLGLPLHLYSTVLCPPLDVEGEMLCENQQEGPSPGFPFAHPTLPECDSPTALLHISLTT